MPVRVRLQFVKPTMRLARPIADAEGRVVAGAGTALREGVVRALRRMAVQSVLVADGEDVAAWETIRPLADELRALDERFGPEAGPGPRRELHAAIARHLAARHAADPGVGAEEAPAGAPGSARA